MIHGLKSYPEYKDSGVPWLGLIPNRWELRKFKHVVSFTGGGTPSKADASLWDGDIPWVSPKDMRGAIIVDALDHINERGLATSATSLVPTGAVLLVVRSGILRSRIPAAINRVDVALNQDMKALRPRSGITSEYLLSWVQGNESNLIAEWTKQGATVESIEHEFLANSRIVLPSLSEQTAIARFLDHADRRIRRYIAAKRKLIALLNEQKQAVIHRAVTRGLDPGVRLKRSGVEWLGEVPAHWDTVRVRSLVRRIDQGISPQAEAGLAEDGAWGVLKAGCVNNGVFRDTEHKRLPKGFEIDEALAVHIGDVLISRASGSPRLVGSVGRVERLGYRLILSDKTFRLVLRDERVADFIVAAMATSYFRVQVEQAISGAEGLANNLPLSALKDFRVAVPPPLEAQRIASVLKAELRSPDCLLDSAQREIDLLHEYRTRLIADVVTGKLDVREAAARLPEESGELEPLEDAEDLAEEDDGKGAEIADDEAD